MVFWPMKWVWGSIHSIIAYADVQVMLLLDHELHKRYRHL